MELLFSTPIGSVLAMAELLSPCSAALIGLQPFRFRAMDGDELRKLRAAIASSYRLRKSSDFSMTREGHEFTCAAQSLNVSPL